MLRRLRFRNTTLEEVLAVDTQRPRKRLRMRDQPPRESRSARLAKPGRPVSQRTD